VTERKTVTHNADAPPPARKCFLLEPGGQATGGKTTPSTVTDDDDDAAMDARQQTEIGPVYYLLRADATEKIGMEGAVRDLTFKRHCNVDSVYFIRNKMIRRCEL
jgi:hypothetical protein